MSTGRLSHLEKAEEGKSSSSSGGGGSEGGREEGESFLFVSDFVKKDFGTAR